MGYIRNGYSVHCVTSDRYVKQIQTFCLENNIPELHFYFSGIAELKSTKNIPLVGEYIHYYLWLIKARKKIKQVAGENVFTHAHHVTFSSIKFGTPLYNLHMKVVLGPLGGGALPDGSLKKYLGRNYYFESFKYMMGDFLSYINPTVRSSIKSADCILVSNDIAAAIIKKYSPIQVYKMFDAGLSDNFEMPFKERSLSGIVNILWIGGIVPRKGLNLAIEAVAHLPAYVNFHFHIVGDGPLKSNAEALVRLLNLQDKVTFTGKLSYDLLEPVFEKSHLLLFPSLIDSCPMQVFESMAYGLPVVTLNHQGMQEQVTTHTGVKVEVNNHQKDYPQALAEAVMSVIADEEIYRQLSLNAYTFGQQQLWKNRIGNFIEKSLEEI